MYTEHPARGRKHRLARSGAAAALALAAVTALAAAPGSFAAGNRRTAVPGNTASPTIVGDVRQGSVVAASTGAWTNDPTSFSFQWSRCDGDCADISGATNETYVVTSADAGKKLQVTVTARNDSGTTSHDSAEQTVASLPAGAPAAQAPPTISGNARQAQVLTAASGSWSGGSVTYRWLRCDRTGAHCAAVSGASGSTYELASGDVGGTVRVEVLDRNGDAESSAVSARTAVVDAASAPSNSGRPSISGIAADNGTLTADKGRWSGDDPITYSYQWRRCNRSGSDCSNIGSNSATYGVTSHDVGHTIVVVVTARNAVGVASATSARTDVVTSPAKPVNRSHPTITGNTNENAVLNALPGDWSGTQPVSLAFQWTRCDSHGNRCDQIGGATGKTYRLTRSDVGHRLRVTVIAKNLAGTATAVSGPTAVVGAAVPTNTSAPQVAGTLRQGSTVTARPGGWSSATGIAFHYQWFRCDAGGAHCTGIVGASNQAYVPTSADVGHRLLVQVRAQNSAGSTTAASKPSGVVAGAASNAVAVAGIALPDRLEVDRVVFSPSRITSRSTPLVARFHVREIDGGKSVSGALVRAIAIPYNRLSATREVVTDGGGWATLTFRVRSGFPLRRGYLITMFVRARKPNESVLAGISTRRLVSVRVG